jgi:hypothetical protein
MRGLIAVLMLLSVVAWAGGVKSRDSDGAPPTTVTDGISLANVSACRTTIRVDGGGDIAAGCQLVPYYYDTALGAWEASAPALICATTTTPDGGRRSSFVCPDFDVGVRSGRVAVAKAFCFGADGGTGAARLADGGAGSQPVVNITCWGEGVVTP